MTTARSFTSAAAAAPLAPPPAVLQGGDQVLPQPMGAPPVALGDSCSRVLRLSRDDIARFAELSGDSNPLHHDVQAAQRARHGEIIASGQQVSSALIGLVSSHFSCAGQGPTREVLGLNFNFSFKAPVFADQQITLRWHVTSVAWHARLAGWLLQAEGQAAVRLSHPAVVARGTLLLRLPAS